MPLTSETVDKLRLIGGAVAKIKAGKKLSKDEQRTLDKLSESPSFDSMSQASAQLGIPKPTLQTWKSKGAPGFRGSRVYPSELLPWARTQQDNPDLSPRESLIIRKLIAECERIEFGNKQERKLYILRSAVEKWITATAEQQKYILNLKLKNQLPPKLEGLRAAEMIPQMDILIREICGKLREIKELI